MNNKEQSGQYNENVSSGQQRKFLTDSFWPFLESETLETPLKKQNFTKKTLVKHKKDFVRFVLTLKQGDLFLIFCNNKFKG